MNLYMIHAGFYDENISGGFYETHTNYFVVAENEKEAKKRARLIDEFKEKKMHIDGIMEIKHADGYDIVLQPAKDNAGAGQTIFSYDDVNKL